MKRRSIVEFEKWLDAEIENVHTEMHGLDLEAEGLSRRRQRQEVRLATLAEVKVRLAPVSDDQTPGERAFHEAMDAGEDADVAEKVSDDVERAMALPLPVDEPHIVGTETPTPENDPTGRFRPSSLESSPDAAAEWSVDAAMAERGIDKQ